MPRGLAAWVARPRGWSCSSPIERDLISPYPSVGCSRSAAPPRSSVDDAPHRRPPPSGGLHPQGRSFTNRAVFRFPSRPLLVGFVGLLAGCAPEKLPATIELTAITPQAITATVTTRPGAQVAMNYADLAKNPVADEHGVVQIVVPRAEWTKRNGGEISVYVDASAFGRRRFGMASCKLPVPTKRLARIPEGDPLYFAYLAGGRTSYSSHLNTEKADKTKAGADETVVLTDSLDEQATAGGKPDSDHLTVWWSPRQSVFALDFAAPAGAKVEIGGASTVVANGLGTIDVPAGFVALSTQMETLGTRKQSLSIPVTVSKDGQTSRHTIPLFASGRHGKPWWLAERIDAAEAGTPFPRVGEGGGGGDIVDAALIRTPRDEVRHVGADGRAGQARWIVIAHAQPREKDSRGHPCPLHRYEDWDVAAVEAHTGKKVASRRFQATDAPCQGMMAKGAGKSIFAPDDASVTAWVRQGIAGAWK
jgi:hypothetical protein